MRGKPFQLSVAGRELSQLGSLFKRGHARTPVASLLQACRKRVHIRGCKGPRSSKWPVPLTTRHPLTVSSMSNTYLLSHQSSVELNGASNSRTSHARQERAKQPFKRFPSAMGEREITRSARSKFPANDGCKNCDPAGPNQQQPVMRVVTQASRTAMTILHRCVCYAS